MNIFKCPTCNIFFENNTGICPKCNSKTKLKFIIADNKQAMTKTEMDVLCEKLDEIEKQSIKEPSIIKIIPYRDIFHPQITDIIKHSPIFIPKKGKRKGYQK